MDFIEYGEDEKITIDLSKVQTREVDVENLKRNNNFHPGLDIQIDNRVKILKFEELKESLIIGSDLIVVGVSSKGIN